MKGLVIAILVFVVLIYGQLISINDTLRSK